MSLTINGSNAASPADGIKISYSQIRRAIARHLGWNRNPDNWTTDQTTDAADIILEGERSFYWPSEKDGIAPHKWSFLCPTVTIALVAGQQDYNLPTDFIRLGSKFTFQGQRQRVLTGVDEEQIRTLRAQQQLDEPPKYFAIRPRPQANDAYELLVYPTPDEAYTLEYRYEMRPEPVSDTNVYHLGPASHSRTFLMSCLMNADRMLNTETANEQGSIDYAMEYAAAMRTSIAIDREVYGVNE